MPFPLHSFPTVKPGKQTFWTNATMRTQSSSYSQSRCSQSDYKSGETFLSHTDFRFLGLKHFMGGKVIRDNHSWPILWAKTQAFSKQSLTWYFQILPQPRKPGDTSITRDAAASSFLGLWQTTPLSHTCKGGSGKAFWLSRIMEI